MSSRKKQGATGILLLPPDIPQAEEVKDGQAPQQVSPPVITPLPVTAPPTGQRHALQIKQIVESSADSVGKLNNDCSSADLLFWILKGHRALKRIQTLCDPNDIKLAMQQMSVLLINNLPPKHKTHVIMNTMMSSGWNTLQEVFNLTSRHARVAAAGEAKSNLKINVSDLRNLAQLAQDIKILSDLSEQENIVDWKEKASV